MTARTLKIRVAVVAGLGLAPVVLLCTLGFLYLKGTGGWWYAAYGGMAGCWLAAYLLGRHWTRRRPPPPAGRDQPAHWTDRDKRAWQVVEEHVAAVGRVTPDDLADFQRYAADAEKLALKVAQVYQPAAADPFGHLTLPEILACGELVSEDLTRIVVKYVPGSHLLRVNDLKQMRTAVDQAVTWYPRLRNLYWVASAFVAPFQTAAQVLTTQAGLNPAFAGFQNNVLLWFHTAYVRELGRYLVELNSGRLKVGAKRYRELMALHQDPGTAPAEPPPGPPAGAEAKPPAADPKPQAPPITVALVGPVKAGKSSLVNALLGEERAATDVLPLTPGATRYTLSKPGQPTLSIMDTAGFGNDGPTEEDVIAAAAAAGEADVLLLVVPARSAARRPESEFLDRVRAGVAAAPQLKMPPTLVVLSHADLLTPAREWTPPYDWRAGPRPKEASMREAVDAARDTFGDRAAYVLPVVTAPGKEFGVKEDVVPTIAGCLDEARGVGLLRALHAEASADRYKRVASQLLNAGGQVLKALWESAKKG